MDKMNENNPMRCVAVGMRTGVLMEKGVTLALALDNGTSDDIRQTMRDYKSEFDRFEECVKRAVAEAAKAEGEAEAHESRMKANRRGPVAQDGGVA